MMSKIGRIITLSVLSILIVICIVLGISYAFMQSNIENNSVTEVTLSSCAKLTLSDTDTSISLTNSYPMSKNRALQTTPYTFSLTSSCDVGVGFNIYLATLNSNTLDASNIHYIITNHGSKNILVEGILSDATNGLSDFTSEEQAQLNSGINGTFANIYKIYVNGIYTNETKEYDLYLYIDESVTDQSTMNQIFVAGVAAKSFAYDLAEITNVDASNIASNAITLTATAVAGENQIAKYYFSKDGGNTFVESDSNSYTFDDLTSDVNYNFVVYSLDSNNYSSNIYNLSLTTKNLKEYCLETNSNTFACNIATLYTTDGENDLYYHDGVGEYTNANLEAGDNSYRYSGVDPNNYVCFATEEATCPIDNLYRIIGVFNGKVKLVKSEFADLGSGGTASLYFTIGAGLYESYKGENRRFRLYKRNDYTNNNKWNESNLNTINLNTNYLNDIGEEWASKIVMHDWQVGGNTEDMLINVAVNEVYMNEILNPAVNTIYSAKVGLMYVSDLAYAIEPSFWNTVISDTSFLTSENWLNIGFLDFTITRVANYPNLIIATSYNIDNTITTYPVDAYSGVRPVFYLDSNVVLASGDGTISSPYRLQLN